jgi:hypothetical protein
MRIVAHQMAMQARISRVSGRDIYRTRVAAQPNVQPSACLRENRDVRAHCQGQRFAGAGRCAQRRRRAPRMGSPCDGPDSNIHLRQLLYGSAPKAPCTGGQDAVSRIRSSRGRRPSTARASPATPTIPPRQSASGDSDQTPPNGLAHARRAPGSRSMQSIAAGHSAPVRA